MSFVDQFGQLPLGELASLAEKATAADVEAALARSGSTRVRIEDFAALVSPTAGRPDYLEAMARRSHELTAQHFGRVIRMFAPLYLSNECINVYSTATFHATIRFCA